MAQVHKKTIECI